MDSISRCGCCRAGRPRSVEPRIGGPVGQRCPLLCPDLTLTLLDSTQKRVQFQKEACALLGLTDVNCLHLRAEEAPAEMRESFDLVVSRAVARLNLLSELCMPFVAVGGSFLAMKGRRQMMSSPRAKKLFPFSAVPNPPSFITTSPDWTHPERWSDRRSSARRRRSIPAAVPR